MNTKQLQRSLNLVGEHFIQRVRRGTKPEGEGILATWEAAFRLAMKGELDAETATAKFNALRPFLNDRL